MVECALVATELEHQTVDIRVLLTDADYQHQLNAQHRGIDKVTNVLSFPESDDPLDASGDIALCLDVVKQEAIDYDVPTLARTCHMVVHATLHLCGYDHQHQQQRQIMEQLESTILTRLRFADPWQH